MLDETRALPAGRLRCRLFGPAPVAELQRDLEQWLANHPLVRVVKAETHLAPPAGGEPPPGVMAAALWYLDDEPAVDIAVAEVSEVIEAAEEVLAAATEEASNGQRGVEQR